MKHTKYKNHFLYQSLLLPGQVIATISTQEDRITDRMDTSPSNCSTLRKTYHVNADA